MSLLTFHLPGLSTQTCPSCSLIPTLLSSHSLLCPRAQHRPAIRKHSPNVHMLTCEPRETGSIPNPPMSLERVPLCASVSLLEKRTDTSPAHPQPLQWPLLHERYCHSSAAMSPSSTAGNPDAALREFFVPFLQLFSRVEKNFFSKVKNKIKQKQMFLFFGPSELTANRQTRYCSMPGLYMNSFTPHNQGEVGIMMIPVSHRNCGALAPTAQSGSGLGFSDGTMVPTSYVST